MAYKMDQFESRPYDLKQITVERNPQGPGVELEFEDRKGSQTALVNARQRKDFKVLLGPDEALLLYSELHQVLGPAVYAKHSGEPQPCESSSSPRPTDSSPSRAGYKPKAQTSKSSSPASTTPTPTKES